MTTDDELMARAKAVGTGRTIGERYLQRIALGDACDKDTIIDLLTRLRTAEAALVEKDADIHDLRECMSYMNTRRS